jgi:hypothetical protein
MCHRRVIVIGNRFFFFFFFFFFFGGIIVVMGCLSKFDKGITGCRSGGTRFDGTRCRRGPTRATTSLYHNDK